MSPRVAVAWFLCALPLAALAQVRSSSEYLVRMDRDGDGRVSLPEYQDWLSYAFDAMDHDRDGVLSAAEQPGGRGAPLARAVHRERLAERFRRQDTNRDNVLSAKELASPPQ
jgi:hypothetical protein